MTCMMNYEIATHLSGARNDTSTLSLRGRGFLAYARNRLHNPVGQ